MCTKTTAIDKDTPPSVPPSVPPITDYIISAAVTNKRGAQVVIDHTSKIIKVSLFKNSAKSDVSISLTLAKGVSLVYPNQSEFRYDLNHEASIWVDYNNAQVKYNVIYEDKNSPEVDPTTLGWTKVSTFGSLPEGFDVYKSPDKLSGKTAIAYLVVADLYKNRKFHTLGEESISDGKTLSQFYNETQYPVIMNGGYFFYSSYTYKLHHIGLLVSDKKVKSIQTSETTRTNSKAENVVFYPTRAVFGMDNEGVFRVDWAYSLNSNITYAYDIPADNKPGEDPKERPSASYPGKGTILNLREGIGAGPVLLKDGKIKNTWLQEIWDDIGGVNVNVDGPRTAIGVSDNKKLMFFVCEGRGRTPNVFGLTTEDVAQALLELSCIDAMSFDGGGSSCLLINGKEVIKPSDGTQRKIVTAIALN